MLHSQLRHKQNDDPSSFLMSRLDLEVSVCPRGHLVLELLQQSEIEPVVQPAVDFLHLARVLVEHPARDGDRGLDERMSSQKLDVVHHTLVQDFSFRHTLFPLKRQECHRLCPHVCALKKRSVFHVGVVFGDLRFDPFVAAGQGATVWEITNNVSSENHTYKSAMREGQVLLVFVGVGALPGLTHLCGG